MRNTVKYLFLTPMKQGGGLAAKKKGNPNRAAQYN